MVWGPRILIEATMAPSRCRTSSVSTATGDSLVTESETTPEPGSDHPGAQLFAVTVTAPAASAGVLALAAASPASELPDSVATASHLRGWRRERATR